MPAAEAAANGEATAAANGDEKEKAIKNQSEKGRKKKQRQRKRQNERKDIKGRNQENWGEISIRFSLLYFSARVVRVTVVCEYARIKLYDFTVMESEEKREW